MAQYYFVAASLPTPTFDEKPFYTSEALLAMCAGELGAADLQEMREAFRYFSGEGVAPRRAGTFAAFDRRERGVRSALARLRAQRLGWELDPLQSEAIGATDASEWAESDVDAEKIARDAFSHESPYDAEMILQRARWQHLEELSVGHYFDIDMLVLYMLKLLVLERNELLQREEGAERFNEIYSGMVQALKETERSE